jgi:phospholipase/carboxylesterase
MTFMAGLRYPERLAGLLGLSGYLPLAALAANERSAANADLPIFQAHGTADAVIPIARALQSRDALVALGHPLEWHAYPMPHSVCPAEIVDMNRWLLRVLAR